MNKSKAFHHLKVMQSGNRGPIVDLGRILESRCDEFQLKTRRSLLSSASLTRGWGAGGGERGWVKLCVREGAREGGRRKEGGWLQHDVNGIESACEGERGRRTAQINLPLDLQQQNRGAAETQARGSVPAASGALLIYFS